MAGNEGMDAVMKTFTAGKKLKPVYIKKLYKKFKQVDKDGSGTIDYPEFLQAPKTLAVILATICNY